MVPLEARITIRERSESTLTTSWVSVRCEGEGGLANWGSSLPLAPSYTAKGLSVSITAHTMTEYAPDMLARRGLILLLLLLEIAPP